MTIIKLSHKYDKKYVFYIPGLFYIKKHNFYISYEVHIVSPVGL